MTFVADISPGMMINLDFHKALYLLDNFEVYCELLFAKLRKLLQTHRITFFASSHINLTDGQESTSALVFQPKFIPLRKLVQRNVKTRKNLI
jgi:hypothetical protein